MLQRAAAFPRLFKCPFLPDVCFKTSCMAWKDSSMHLCIANMAGNVATGLRRFLNLSSLEVGTVAAHLDSSQKYWCGWANQAMFYAENFVQQCGPNLVDVCIC